MSALWVILAFASGAIPFGYLLARRRGVDIRTQGSGNIGATNVTRVLGPRLGALVLVLDAAKGAVPVLLARDGGAATLALVGGAAIVGHCFSPWLGGRGGKGVATALGVFLVLEPQLVAIAVAIFAAVLGATRVPALGSLAGVAAIAIGLAVHAPWPLAALGAATFALLVFTHRGNLAKLRR